MPKKQVQFAQELVRSIHQNEQDAVKSATMLAEERKSSRWYSSKELRAIHIGIQSLVISSKPVWGTQGRVSRKSRIAESSPAIIEEDNCLRGLEYFQSNARRELRKQFVSGVIETQRILRHMKRSQGEVNGQDPATLLQEVAEKYSQYARDRAHAIAVHDARDARSVHDEDVQSIEPPAAKKLKLCPAQSEQLLVARFIRQVTPDEAPEPRELRTDL
jgi:hypothetical protein